MNNCYIRFPEYPISYSHTQTVTEPYKWYQTHLSVFLDGRIHITLIERQIMYSYNSKI